jgi:hypothetical protein
VTSEAAKAVLIDDPSAADPMLANDMLLLAQKLLAASQLTAVVFSRYEDPLYVCGAAMCSTFVRG